MFDWNKNLYSAKFVKNKGRSKKNATSKIKQKESSKIMVNFEIFDPVISHFEGIHGLISRLLINFNLEVAPLVNQIIHQSDASSVLLDSKEKTIFGIIGALSLNYQQNDIEEWSTFLKTFLSALKIKCNRFSSFDSIFKSKRVAFLFNERFLNLPEDISFYMVTSLKNELENMKEKVFDYFIYVSKCYSGKKAKSDKVTPFNKEDFIFYKNSCFSEVFNVFDECGPVLTGSWSDTDESYIPYRAIHIIERSKMLDSLNKILR